LILKKRYWIGILFEGLFAIIYIAVNLRTNEVDDHNIKIGDLTAKPIMGLGITMFPIYQIMQERVTSYLKHLII